jgi:phosphoribosylamine---glycine ligase
MKVLVVGSGGREHALCQAISRSPFCEKLWCAPGNPGITQVAECVPIEPHRTRELVNFANVNRVDLVVVGPEGPLVDGLTNAMEVFGIPCFGPDKTRAKLEGSKYYTKAVCGMLNIPTASWQSFDYPFLALEYVRMCSYPKVIKADGLAAGKGVFIVNNVRDATDVVRQLMVKHELDEAGRRIIIEECLEGTEVSFFALCDGVTAIPFGTAQDHKRLGNGDIGPNTGGMGAVSPAPAMTPELHETIWETIVLPIVKTLEFSGVLFVGLMITADGPKLLEFNVRFGDPECQALLMRLQSDLLPLLEASAKQKLSGMTAKFSSQTAVSVVMAAKGYPGPSRMSVVNLAGLKSGSMFTREGDVVFHSGTKPVGKTFVSIGGRVLTVCGMGDTVYQARDEAYDTISRIDWPDGIYRTDIGLTGS